MSTAADVRAAVVARLASVANVGRVHSYQRYEPNAAALTGLYRTEQAAGAQLRGWYVTRTASQQLSPHMGRLVIVDTFELRGFMALDDAAQSELAMDALVEAIRNAFNADQTLGGVITGFAETGEAAVVGVQVAELLPVMFGGALCHSARLTLQTVRYENLP